MTVSGAGFSDSSTASAIVIRLDSRVGPILASVPRAEGGTFEVTFVVPRTASVGYHTFLATQEIDGRLAFVAREVFQVLPPTGPANGAQATGANQVSVFDPAALATPIGMGALALSGAIALMARRLRRAR